MDQVLSNGRIVTTDGILDGYELRLAAGRIEAVSRAGTTTGAERRHVDACGAYIMPGMIDLHSDFIERMAAPRPNTRFDMGLALRETERELITHGITTMFHSISIFDHMEFNPSPVRTPEATASLIECIEASRRSRHLVRHRLHARFELDALSRVGELEGYIRDKRVQLLSFMDHTPGQGQFRDLEVFRSAMKAYRGLTDTAADAEITRTREREKITIDRVTELSAVARAQGIAVASHDDDTVDKLNLVSSVGATISEFPITLEVARAARGRGMHTVAGAPNVLLGGSHSGNLSAADAVIDGAIDVLCSDYFPAAMVHAVFILHETHSMPLADAVRLVSHNPATALGTAEETGSLETGKSGDLIVVGVSKDGRPAVTDAFVGADHVYSARYRR